MIGVPQNMQDGDTVSASGGRLITTTERGGGIRSLMASIVNLIKTGSTSRSHTLQDADGTIPLLEVSPVQSFRNKIINGDLRIWQRGTSFTGVVSANTYTADRAYYFVDGTLGAFSVSQQAFALGTISPEFPFFYRFNVTATGSGSSNTVAYGQRIEGVRTFANRRIVVSFWAKADAVRTITPRVVQVMGTGGAPSGNVTTTGTAINLSTTWTQYVQAITVPSLSGKTLGTNGDDCLAIELLAANNTVETIDLSMIEVRDAPASEGTLLLPWELRPLQAELSLCGRYLPALKSGSVNTYTCTGYCSTTTQAAYFFPLRVSPRVPPTGAIFAAATSYGVNDGAINTVCASMAFLSSGDGVAVVLANVAAGLVANRPVTLQVGASADILFTGCEL